MLRLPVPCSLLPARRLRWNEGPVILILRAFRYPLLQRLLLRIGQHPLALGWRHEFIRVGVEDALQQRALSRVTRHNRTGLDRVIANIEPQLAVAMRWVRPVAEETLVTEDGPHIAVELHARLRSPVRCRREQDKQAAGRSKDLFHEQDGE